MQTRINGIELEPNERAGRDFRRIVKNVNIFTPRVLMFGYLGPYVIEISSGEGINREKMYGVTVVDLRSEQADHLLSKACFSIDEINDHLTRIRAHVERVEKEG